jgi:hypothetical protein
MHLELSAQFSKQVFQRLDRYELELSAQSLHPVLQDILEALPLTLTIPNPFAYEFMYNNYMDEGYILAQSAYKGKDLYIYMSPQDKGAYRLYKYDAKIYAYKLSKIIHAKIVGGDYAISVTDKECIRIDF